MSNKEISKNIGALVTINSASDAITKGYLVLEREKDYVLAFPKFKDNELHKHIKYEISFGEDKIAAHLEKGWQLSELVTVYMDDQLYEYKHFLKSEIKFTILDEPKNKPKLYSSLNNFNAQLNLPVGFFGSSESNLPELDRIIITSIGNENFYYHWNGMPFVSKKYMIQNSNELTLGISSLVIKGEEVYINKGVNETLGSVEQWYKQFKINKKSELDLVI